MFSNVIFDLDGTLLDTLQDIVNACNYTLNTLSYPIHSTEKYKLMVGNGIKKLVIRMLPERHQDPATVHLALAIFTEYYEKHSSVSTAPYPGILPLLQKLKLAHVQLAILSNKNDKIVAQISQHYFPHIFHFTWGYRPDYLPKPDPQSLYALLGELCAKPANTLYCGDSDVDIYTAKNAGITSCGVLWGFRGEKELSAAGANYIVQTPEQIAEIALSVP